MNFAQRIKQVRVERKLTQVQMAALLGHSPRAYQGLELGTGKPNYDTLLSFADKLDVSVDYLMGRTDDAKVHL